MLQKHQNLGPRVLLICDRSDISNAWLVLLKERNLNAAVEKNAESVLAVENGEPFDLIIIDIYNRQIDISKLCKDLRLKVIAPILLFAFVTSEADILEAYATGIDECVAKPVSPALFLCKINSWIRRSGTIPTGALNNVNAGDFHLDCTRRCIVSENGSQTPLTNLEFRLLYLLMSHPQQILETNDLIDSIWGYANEGDSNLLKNLVYRLRRKL